MRKVARSFASLLRQPQEGLPATVVFHAMVAGFNIDDPTTDPNAFFTYLVDDPAICVKTRFVALHAPPLVATQRLKELRDWEGIRESYERASELDVIVTAASEWRFEDHLPHVPLWHHMQTRSPKSLERLTSADCIGGMLWRPLSHKGPIAIETEVRAMTLMELNDLPGFIGKGGKVLLVLGPCAACHRPKPEVLKAVLTMDSHLITHLVVDSISVRMAQRLL